MSKIKIIVVDDHQIVRDGISALLMQYDDIEIIAEASNGEQLLRLLKSLSPNIIILDIAMPKITGIELAKIINKEYTGIQIIIFSSQSEGENVIKALEAGAKAVLPKTTLREELIQAIYSVNQGNEFISKYIPYSTFVNNIKQRKTENDNIKDLKKILTDREIEIMNLIVNSLTNQEIAEKLFISQRTVEKHKSNILSKLELKSVVDMVKFALKNKMTEL
ncbi:MAG: response regulator transcription factor [Bacteroidales bacterium]|nr:response regulator transcription factor [Bacteroidales bacterium]